MSIIVNGVEITAITFEGVDLDAVYFDNTMVWDKFNLIDFEYYVENGIAKITGWKGTLNGVPSTICEIPNEKYIQIYNIDFTQYKTMTSITIQNNVSVYNNSLFGAFSGMKSLKTTNINCQDVTNISAMYYFCYNLIL